MVALAIGAGTLQEAYNAAPAVPQLLINSGQPLTIDAIAAGDIFSVRDSSNVDRFRVSDTEIRNKCCGNIS